MSNDFRDQFVELMNKYYNLDRRDPITLTAKRPMMGNPLHQIADELEQVIAALIQMSTQPPEPPEPEDEEVDRFIDEGGSTILDDFDEEDYHWFGNQTGHNND